MAGWLALIWDVRVGAGRVGVVTAAVNGFVATVRLSDGELREVDGLHTTYTLSPDRLLCSADEVMRAIGDDLFSGLGAASHALRPFVRSAGEVR